MMSDEATVRQSLPPLFETSDGRIVTDTEEWTSLRRPELLEAFRSNVYGRAPVARPVTMRLDREEVDSDVPATRRIDGGVSYSGHGGEGSIGVRIYLPAELGAEALPVLLLGSNRDARSTLPVPGPDGSAEATDFWPVDAITAAGFATAAFAFSEVDPDEHDGFGNGVHGLFDQGERGLDAWGTIAAWAWGFSRVADLLATVPELDQGRIGAVGHSRGGKTALWAAAQDERFALAMANGSGSTGAAVARGKSGERISDIVTRFPHWFCSRYAEFSGREEELPVDQHQLLALIAPRLLYLGNAEDDAWADPASERAALRAAAPAWGLFGHPADTDVPMETEAGTVNHGPSLGYHLRPGAHDLTREDWRHLLAFAQTRL